MILSQILFLDLTAQDLEKEKRTEAPVLSAKDNQVKLETPTLLIDHSSTPSFHIVLCSFYVELTSARRKTTSNL